jgi:hypothetical protein
MTPAYNLRVGKAADRLLLRDLLARTASLLDLADYRYVGLGGPFLEDFRLIHDAFPMMKLSSVERKEHVWRRQKFHRPSRYLELHHCGIDHYFANLHDDSERVVLWLDYTGLNHNLLKEVWGVIPRLSAGSILRVTLRAEGAEETGLEERKKWAQETFGSYLPDDFTTDELDTPEFPKVLLRAVRKMIENATANLPDIDFQLVNAVYYDDGTQMMTITGLLADSEQRREMRRVLQNWEFKNFNWTKPFSLALPALSLKERFTLEPLLPSRRGTGKALYQKLGYSIEDSKTESLTALDNYRRLSEAYPRFARIAF